MQTLIDVYFALYSTTLPEFVMPSNPTVEAWTDTQRNAVIQWCRGKRNQPGFFRFTGSTLPTRYEMTSKIARRVTVK